MASIFWSIADRNPYIALQCEAYAQRHDNVTLRKWWHLAKAICKNRSRYVGVDLKTEGVYGLVDLHDIISFDIFDTLLTRPYGKPTDLFFELEENAKSRGFGNKRIEAERRARKRYQAREEITLAQIYQEIDDEYKHLMTKEMELEEAVLSVNHSICDIYQYALRKGKKIVICSDMYLPKKFLENVLHQKGYQGFSELYLSSDLMMTKGSGSLFQYMLRDLNVRSLSVLHIGDNLESDGKCISYGIEYICVKKSHFIKIERARK